MLEDTLGLNPPVWFNCLLCLTVHVSYWQNLRIRGGVLDRVNLGSFLLCYHLHNKLISRSLVYIKHYLTEHLVSSSLKSNPCGRSHSDTCYYARTPIHLSF